MIEPKKLFANYQCVKCRGRSFNTEEISLRSRNKRGIIRPTDDPYLVVTCGLCGFSELYSMKVLATQKEDAPVEVKSPMVKESETSG
ncbi:MAG: zinc ribbon domain-containing protein [Candidatus Hinthialibacter antarcticus]|nr:zinc ribbon domain-containing protein [Candidatus Hinthialibacter antarcticus]